MALTRRQFLARTGLVTAGSFFGPGLSNPFLREALAETIGDRYLIVLFLDGGNDGLNTVTPMGNGDNSGTYGFSTTLRDAYTDVRTSIALPIGSLVPIGTDAGTNTPLGLHPGFGNMQNLISTGNVAVIQACGYPDPNLSHATSRRKWETADPLGVGDGTGWVGRHLAANYGSFDLPALAFFRGGVPGELSQATTGVLAMSLLRQFTFPYHRGPSSPQSEKDERDVAFQALHDAALVSGQPLVELTGQVGSAVLSATQVYPGLHDDYLVDRPDFNLSYNSPGNTNPDAGARSSTARDLREIAKSIYGVENGKVNSRFFELRNGGYDTHSNQGGASGNHFNLHSEVATALDIFWEDITDMGVADKVCVLIWSEFSRRVKQNDSGTDHGSQGPMFVIGGKVAGGAYGNFPDIGEEITDLKNGNTVYLQGPASTPFRATDFRDVYGTVLKHWLNVMPDAAVSAILPPDEGDPDFYWTAPNFDLPLFLP